MPEDFNKFLSANTNNYVARAHCEMLPQIFGSEILRKAIDSPTKMDSYEVNYSREWKVLIIIFNDDNDKLNWTLSCPSLQVKKNYWIVQFKLFQ